MMASRTMLPKAPAALQEVALRQLIQAGAAIDFVVRGQAGGFVIESLAGPDGTRDAVLGHIAQPQ